MNLLCFRHRTLWSILVLVAGLTMLMAQGRPSFDVASVKLRPASEGPQTSTMNDEAGAVHYSNVALKSCILAAYGLQPSQLRGMDGHFTERYDIDAKSSGRATGAALMLMLQSLLEERFQLKYHAGAEQMPVYKLAAGKSVRLQVVSGADAGIDYAGGPTPHLFGQTSMKHLAEFLSGICDRPVVDITGLAGVYNVRLEWTAGPTRSDGQDALFSAIESKLGLKMESGTDSVKTMVIDRFLTKPTEN